MFSEAREIETNACRLGSKLDKADMRQLNQEDWLDRELREAAPYIDDEGFTARVLQQLPPPRRGHDLLRAAILLGMTFLRACLPTSFRVAVALSV
jgi:hypothetical protein